MDKKSSTTKVLVAMSGGVDSSVAAALLKKAGFEVVGGFMKCWAEKNAMGQCSDIEDAEMARHAANKLGIPFYTFDFTNEYREKVFDYFVSEYKAGRTPNPDVVCNTCIKFGAFLQRALSLGFDKIATGHYVRLSTNNESFTNKRINESANHKFVPSKQSRYSLMRAKDKNKDQSYFLWQLRQEQLRHCLFPIGGYTKHEVRELARTFGLPNAERKDSQGLCFVGKVKLADFLAPYIPPKRGKIMDKEGNVLGWHMGVAAFTIGQRHGIGLAGGPWWVFDKDVQNNILIVSRNEKDLYKKEVVVENVNWISGQEPKLPLRVDAAIRYRQKPEAAVLSKLQTTKYKLLFLRPQRAPALGQSVVFWQREELLGGGVLWD